MFWFWAKACPGKKQEDNRNVNIITAIPKNSVKINDVELHDTVSDISRMRNDIFDTYLQCVILIEEIICLKGPNKVKTICYWDKTVFMNDEEVYVVLKYAFGFVAIIGNKVLEYCNILIDSYRCTKEEKKIT